MIVCSFSGDAADLPKRGRNVLGLLRVLARHPRVSTWDMSEKAWLRSLVAQARRQNLIEADASEPYPWHRYTLTGAGRFLAEGRRP